VIELLAPLALVLAVLIRSSSYSGVFVSGGDDTSAVKNVTRRDRAVVYVTTYGNKVSLDDDGMYKRVHVDWAGVLWGTWSSLAWNNVRVLCMCLHRIHIQFEL
jgi:hypothetical protein